MLELMQEGARIIFGRDGYHLPTAAVRTGDKVKIYGTEFHDAVDEEAFSMLMVSLAREADEIIFIAEAWLLEHHEDNVNVKDVMRRYSGGLKNVPGRKEVLMVIRSTPDEEQSCIAEITRLSNGPPLLGPFELKDYGQFQGRMCNWFGKARPQERN